MKRLPFNRKGITLIELLITLAIMTIVLQIIYSIFFAGNKSFNIGKDKGFAQQDARILSAFITNELRAAKNIAAAENVLSGKYYSLSTNGGKLIKKTYDGSITDLNILSDTSLITLKFNNVKAVKERVEEIIPGILKVTIVVKEGKDKEVEFTFDVILENISNYYTNIDQDIIYYEIYE